jgi:hypothetical protein
MGLRHPSGYFGPFCGRQLHEMQMPNREPLG